jgi:hypothetical protein
VSNLNEKKSYLAKFRETLPFEEKKRLVFEISNAQTAIKKVETQIFRKKEEEEAKKYNLDLPNSGGRGNN